MFVMSSVVDDVAMPIFLVLVPGLVPIAPEESLK